MSESLPEMIREFIKPLPLSRDDESLAETIEKFKKLYGEEYVNSQIWCKEDAENILNEMGVESDTTLYKFYLNSFESPNVFRSEDLYGLIEIYQDYKDPFGSELNGNSRKVLRISSIEGEYSLFYDIRSGQVYGVDWKDKSEFINGNLDPLFNSFYEFLTWYYSDAEE